MPPACPQQSALPSVDLDISECDGKARVCFRRLFWSEHLQKHYMANEVILVLTNDLIHPISEDFQIYKELDEDRQREALKQLKESIYTGRILSAKDLPTPAPLPIEEVAAASEPAPQMSLF